MTNERETRQDDRPDEPGAEREQSESADDFPAAPSDDESPAGDTDQHSAADA